jgi:hypothetical protein
MMPCNGLRRAQMTRTVTGGSYRRDNEAAAYYVGNESTVFPTLNPQGPLPPPGAEATATLQKPPNTPYAVNEQVMYFDGNNNNTVHFTVQSVVGPSKYKLSVRL